MSFPEKEKKSWFIFTDIVPVGWEVVNYNIYESEKVRCRECNSIAKMGRENGESFLYCPSHMLKLTVKKVTTN